MKIRRSSKEWFSIWQKLIYEKNELSRVDLADLSGASIWIIKALQNDFVEWDAYVSYEGGKFKKIGFELDKTLSLSLQEELR